jgi:hypothetical protein
MASERPPTSGVLAACAGFLLGVLWMDLMFDVQVLRHPGGAVLPEPVLASIAGYYHRVTTDAQPMGSLIAAVMVVAVGGALWRAIRMPGWRTALSVLLVTGPVALALGRVVPNAVRLGLRSDPVAVQSELARGIFRGHLVCLASVAAFLFLELHGARRAGRGRVETEKGC